MAYSIHPHQVAFFSYNEWSETPAHMLHPLMVKTLQNTQHFQAIVTPPYLGCYDYALSTQILQLEQDFCVKPAMVHLTVRAQLSHGTTHQVLATREFSIHEPLEQNTPYGGVIAANHATAKMLEQLIAFVLGQHLP